MYINPFRPTGPFLAPKLIILINFNWIFFQSVVLVFLYVEQDVIWHSSHVQVLKIEKKRKLLKIQKKIVLQPGWNGLMCKYMFLVEFSQHCRNLNLRNCYYVSGKINTVAKSFLVYLCSKQVSSLTGSIFSEI